MKRLFTNLIYVIPLIFIFSCSTVAVTGRKQLLLVSNEEVLSLSQQSFSDYMKSAKPSSNQAKTQMVRNVGQRIAKAVESYLVSEGRGSDVQGFAWEFHLVQDPNANAFCMPGGKIVVNEGILPYTKTEDELAIILGHEIAHAVAKHSAERMSQQMLVNYGGVILDGALNMKSPLTRTLAQQVYGLGAQYGVMLPYSRSNEVEADHLGLIFAYMAGYNPEAAITFWQRMSAGGQSIPEFMSTHPSDQTRINKLNQLIPKVKQKNYKQINAPKNTQSQPQKRSFKFEY